MTDYTIHTRESAPEASREALNQAHEKYGFVPNMLGIMAEAPGLLQGYLALGGLFENGSLSPTEQEIVMLSVSFENRCEYCMGAHSTVAGMKQVPESVVGALRDGRPLEDQKLEALRMLVHSIVVNRGFPDAAALSGFHEAGYSRAQLLEVVLGVGIKTLSNYTNHITETPLDEVFSQLLWKHPDTRTVA